MAPILDMTNKVFAVTGAASGIGRAVACLLYQAGASLSVADIDGKGLRQLEKDLHMSWPGYTGKIMATALDITKSDQVENWVASTTEAMGPLDGGANMAGIASSVSFPDGIIDVTDEDWSRMINVNLTGLFYCIRAQARGDRMKDGGSIVTAGSAMAKQGNPKDGGYAASKHGVLGLSRSMAKELGNERGIRVNCVCPYVPLYTFRLACA